MNKKEIKVGAHVSMAGGLDKALERAQAIGANCMQIFSGSPRVWKREELDKVDVNLFFSKQRELNVSPVFTHTLYLINLASPNRELLDKSIVSVIYDLKFDSLIKGSGAILHIGSHLGVGFDAVKDTLLITLDNILKNTPKDSTLLLENTAGQKGKIGSLTEIKWLIDKLQSKRVGWCFDTCHSFASGLSLEKVGEEINNLKLWKTLKCIHVNDSRDQFDSHRDRHDNLGEGKIATASLKLFLNLPEVKFLPMILEVPGMDKKGPDKENIKRLRQLVLN